MRTDNDTWDIKTSVGATALFVAAARALEATKPDPLTVDRYAELFCRAAGGQWAGVLDGTADSKLITEWGTHFIDFQAARTRYFDAYVAVAVDAGVRQFVLLAAGLDSRAYRLRWPTGAVLFELDQPRVLHFKHEVLSSVGASPAAERREVAVDLRDNWPQALADSGFDPSRTSAFLAEGLMVYLPASAQERLYRGVDALSVPGSRVAIEEGKPMPAAAFEAAKAAERAAGEDGTFFTLTYNERCAPADQWLGQRGWTAVRTPLGDYLRKFGRALPAPGTQAEQMIASNALISAVKR